MTTCFPRLPPPGGNETDPNGTVNGTDDGNDDDDDLLVVPVITTIVGFGFACIAVVRRRS